MTKHLLSPKHLRVEGCTFWTQMIREYAISDVAGLALLALACECLDRMASARVAIEEHGEIVFNNKGDAAMNPACRLEKESRNGFLAAMRALHIDVEPLRDGPGTPPGTFNRAR